MSALIFLGAMVVVLWLGVWIFQEPIDDLPHRPPPAAPFDYADLTSASMELTNKNLTARWRQRRALPGRKP